MALSRDFKGIWIPKEIWLESKLTIQEKLFYIEIDSLDNEDGCFANNQHFSDMFEISKTRCSIVISHLEQKGYIKSKLIYKEGSKQILKRVLNISYRPYPTNVKEGYITNVIDPTQQMFKDSNTLSNTSISNTTNNTINKDLKAEFDMLWQDYPRKIGKPNALKSYIKYRKSGTTFEEVQNGLDSYNYFNKQNKIEIQFILHGSTWFNGQRWTDDNTVIVQQQKSNNVFADLYEKEYGGKI